VYTYLQVFFVSNRLGNLSSEDQHVELHAIDLATFAVRDIPSTIPMANGAAAYRDDFDDGLAVTAQVPPPSPPFCRHFSPPTAPMPLGESPLSGMG